MSSQRPSVLVVEDDADNLELLKFFLESEGMMVTPARSLAEALHAARSNAPDLLISDLELGDSDGDGCALLAQLRALPGCQRLPAMALTGHATSSVRAEAIAAGFDDYVVKPIELSELTGRVTKLLEGAMPRGIERGEPAQSNSFRAPTPTPTPAPPASSESQSAGTTGGERRESRAR